MSPKNPCLLLPFFFIFLLGCAPTDVEPTDATATATIATLVIERPSATPQPTATAEQEIVIERPSATPTATMPPDESPTMTPTLVPSSTPSATPTKIIGANVVTALPTVSHDLLVVADGSLKLWNHETGQIEILLASLATEAAPDEIGSISRFSIDAAGENLIASRLVGENPPTHNLIKFNLVTKEHQVLIYNIPYLLDFEISPDGLQTAYIVGDPETFDSYWGVPSTGKIYTTAIAANQTPEQIGSCSNMDTNGEIQTKPICMRLVWSPDSKHISWADHLGIWEYDLNLSGLHLLHESYYGIREDALKTEVFRPIDWSPSGRYLRLSMGHYEGSSESILDTQTGQLFEIPDTFFHVGIPGSSVSWMQDERLFVVRSKREGNPFRKYNNSAEIWHIPTDTEELILDWSTNIPTNPRVYLTQATQLQDGTLAFMAGSFEIGDETDGFYVLEQGTLKLIHQLPSQVDYYELVLTSTGDEALVVWYIDKQDPQYTGTTYDFVYVNVNDPLLYYVRPFLGDAILNTVAISWVE